ncbi:MAG: DUF2283 domain-containing protein [Candidatus Bathyarchaeales archaeon]
MTEMADMSFGKPREVKDSIEVDDEIIYRIADNEIVGITITNFKARTLKNSFSCKI